MRYYPGFVQMAIHEQNVVQTTIFDDRNETAVQEAARPDTSRQPPWLSLSVQFVLTFRSKMSFSSRRELNKNEILI